MPKIIPIKKVHFSYLNRVTKVEIKDTDMTDAKVNHLITQVSNSAEYDRDTDIHIEVWDVVH